MLNKYDMSEKLVRTGFSYEQSNTIAEVIVQSIREVEMQKKAERNNKIKSILEGDFIWFFYCRYRYCRNNIFSRSF
ncbi:TPA: hypothetical protein RHI53_003641 [Acinetobacter baumannii]|nr:hypothetical protein [Acinetobacter baumannii]